MSLGAAAIKEVQAAEANAAGEAMLVEAQAAEEAKAASLSAEPDAVAAGSKENAAANQQQHAALQSFVGRCQHTCNSALFVGQHPCTHWQDLSPG